jgi:NADH:ubiquinone oxidoreductase subunit H
MGIGIGIVLLVLGLILVTGAVDLPASVDDAIAGNTLGWIFLLVGVLAIVLAVAMTRRTRPVAGATEVTERRYEA